mgnify:CR=1 FL=1
MAVRISGLINTWNEAETIRYAVESLKSWCDEVVVVDHRPHQPEIGVEFRPAQHRRRHLQVTERRGLVHGLADHLGDGGDTALAVLHPHESRSQELLVLFGIAWGLALAALGVALGFSKEVGAFLAGVSIASTPYRELVAARLVSLRDFLLLFFFIELGANLDMSTLGEQTGAAIIFSLFVLIGNPLIVMIIMGYMGYRKRTGFLAGLTVAQISEFSLILAALGLSLGHLDQSTVGLVTLVGLITISASTYMILYSHQLYARLSPYLGWFERKVTHRETDGLTDHSDGVDVLLFGLGRFGSTIADRLREQGCRIQAIDFNPTVVRLHERAGYQARYGDAEDPEFIGTLPLEQATLVVSTLRDRVLNRALLQGLQQQSYRVKVAVSTSTLVTPAGVARVTGPATRVTCAPCAASALATAKPILPELRLAMKRTGSIGSRVGPAVTSARRPASRPSPQRACRYSRIAAGSLMRPAPWSPQACSPTAGPTNSTPRAANRATLSVVVGCPHMAWFIAGAINSGASEARHSVDSRSCARPAAVLAMKSAVASIVASWQASSAQVYSPRSDGSSTSLEPGIRSAM